MQTLAILIELTWKSTLIAGGALVALRLLRARSAAQRSLSKPARTLRRHVRAIDGTATFDDGHQQQLTTTSLIAPLEAALRATAAAVVALAVALVIYRATTP